MKEGTEMTNPRRIAGGIAAAVLGGGASAALLLGPATTSASTPTSTEVAATVDEPDDTTATAEEGGDTAVPAEEADQPGSMVRELLQPLVDDGTLTAEQADAIAAQLPMNAPGQNGPGGPGEPGGRGDGPFRQRFRVVDADVIAEAIGIDVTELREALRSGSTVAEVAEANGVDPQVVIDALVADYTERVTAWIEGEQQTITTETEEPTDTAAATETTAAA